MSNSLRNIGRSAIIAAWVWLSTPVAAQVDWVDSSSELTVSSVTETQMLAQNVLGSQGYSCDKTVIKDGKTLHLNISMNPKYPHKLYMIVDEIITWGWLNIHNKYWLIDNNLDDKPNLIKWDSWKTNQYTWANLHTNIVGPFDSWYALIAQGAQYNKALMLQQEVLDAFAFDANCWPEKPKWMIELPKAKKAKKLTLRWSYQFEYPEIPHLRWSSQLKHIVD